MVITRPTVCLLDLARKAHLEQVSENLLIWRKTRKRGDIMVGDDEYEPAKKMFLSGIIKSHLKEQERVINALNKATLADLPTWAEYEALVQRHRKEQELFLNNINDSDEAQISLPNEDPKKPNSLFGDQIRRIAETLKPSTFIKDQMEIMAETFSEKHEDQMRSMAEALGNQIRGIAKTLEDQLSSIAEAVQKNGDQIKQIIESQRPPIAIDDLIKGLRNLNE